MASVVFSSAAELFGVGTTVGAYVPNLIPDAASPVSGAAVTTAVVASDGSLTFAGLADDTAYVAYDSVSGRRRRFRSAPLVDSSRLSLGAPQTADYPVVPGDVGTVVSVNASATKRVALQADSVLTNAQIGSSLYVLNVGTADAYVAPQVDNLVPNPSVENNTAGYGGRGSVTIAQVTAASTPAASAAIMKGAGALRITTTAASGTVGMFFPLGSLTSLGLKVGDLVSARYDIDGSGIPSGARVGIRFQSGSTTISESLPGAAITTTGVSKVDGATIPAGCDGITLLIFATSSGTGQTIDADGLVFCKGPTAPASYADPSTNAEMSWLGTAHASRSQLPKVTGSVTSVPPGGMVRAVRVAANSWAIVTQPQSDVMLDTDAFYADRDNGLGGLFAPVLAGTTSQALVSGTLYAVRLCPSRDMLVSTISYRVETAAGGNDAVEVGLLDAAGVRVATSGSTVGKLNATGEQTVNLGTAFTLLKGNVYYAYVLWAGPSAAPNLAQVTTGGAKLAGVAAPSALILTKAAQTIPIGTPVSGLGAVVTGPLLFVK